MIFFNICPLYNNLHFIHFANYPVDKFNIFGMFLKRSDVRFPTSKSWQLEENNWGLQCYFHHFKYFYKLFMWVCFNCHCIFCSIVLHVNLLYIHVRGCLQRFNK